MTQPCNQTTKPTIGQWHSATISTGPVPACVSLPPRPRPSRLPVVLAVVAAVLLLGAFVVLRWGA